jgi:hypothetical protein
MKSLLSLAVSSFLSSVEEKKTKNKNNDSVCFGHLHQLDVTNKELSSQITEDEAKHLICRNTTG